MSQTSLSPSPSRSPSSGSSGSPENAIVVEMASPHRGYTASVQIQVQGLLSLILNIHTSVHNDVEDLAAQGFTLALIIRAMVKIIIASVSAVMAAGHNPQQIPYGAVIAHIRLMYTVFRAIALPQLQTAVVQSTQEGLRVADHWFGELFWAFRQLPWTPEKGPMLADIVTIVRAGLRLDVFLTMQWLHAAIAAFLRTDMHALITSPPDATEPDVDPDAVHVVPDGDAPSLGRARSAECLVPVAKRHRGGN